MSKGFGLTHSLIPSYPPDVTKFPLFYNCKEYIVILHPGEALYIPSNWFHWVFSYPESENERTNIAISYKFYDKSGKKIKYTEPLKYKLDKNKYEYFNYTFDTLKTTYKNKKIHNVCKSKKNILVPVEKPTLKNKIYEDALTLTEIEKQSKEYNLYIQQNDYFQPHDPPTFMKDYFTKIYKCSFYCHYWILLFNSQTNYIDSGLHYDGDPGLLICIKGIKIVRLYHPNDYENLYVQTMKYRDPKDTQNTLQSSSNCIS